MEDFKIEVEEDKSYWQRMKKAFLWRLIILTGFCSFLYFMPVPNKKITDLQSLLLVLGIYVPFLIINVLACDYIYASHVSFLEITETHVRIIFTKRNKHFTIDDSIDNFKFNLGGADFYPLHVNITYKNYYTIRQFRKWNWKKVEAYDQLLEYLKKRNLLNTGWFS